MKPHFIALFLLGATSLSCKTRSAPVSNEASVDEENLEDSPGGCEALTDGHFLSLRKYQFGGPTPTSRPSERKSLEIHFRTDGTYEGFLQDSLLKGRFVCKDPEGLIVEADDTQPVKVLGSYNVETGLLLWNASWYRNSLNAH